MRRSNVEDTQDGRILTQALTRHAAGRSAGPYS
jgi:hypothetical protein